MHPTRMRHRRKADLAISLRLHQSLVLREPRPVGVSQKWGTGVPTPGGTGPAGRVPGCVSAQGGGSMIEIQLFGPTTVSCGGIRVTATDLGGGKPRQLLEMLALDVGVPVSKELLAERLWEARPPRAYIPTIESHVCGIRRRLGELTGEHGALVTTVGGYLLDKQRVRVDLDE